jgi:pimeloyl-ACP methyl ester carboxylesterase
MNQPLVLLHPFPLDATFWDPVAARLAAERAVHAPEFPGFGRAPASPRPSIAAAAEAVADRIASQAVGGRAVICGVSMGGYTALALASRRPETVAGLILCGTRAGADAHEAREGRLSAARALEAGDLDGFLAEMIPRLAPPWDTATLGSAEAIARRQDPAAMAGALRAMAERPDRSGELASVEVPALVMWGEHDQAIGADHAWELADGLSGGELNVIAGAGHLVPLERPDQFVALAREFLHGIDAGDP